ncbi:MAG: hypothetical protein ACPG31_06335 [Planctomycetota bacterium]
MRNILAILAGTCLASTAVAQTVTHDVVFYQGDSGLNDWGVYRHTDIDGDGVFLSAGELNPFGVDGQTQINYVKDLRYRNEGGTDYLYVIATNYSILRLEDIDGDGRVDGLGEIVVWADVLAAGGFSSADPEAMDFDPITGTCFMTDEYFSSGPGQSTGIHAYTDNNADGDANDAGEYVRFVDANIAMTVPGTAGAVTIDPGDLEGLMFDSTNGIVIAYANQDGAIYAFQDLNGDGDAHDAGEAWNFCNLSGNLAGLEQNADVMSGALHNPACVSSGGTGLFSPFELLDFAPGAGPGGADVYWLASNASGSCPEAAGQIYRGIDLNGDLDLNDAGEVTQFLDGPNSPVGIPAMYGGAAHDNGYSVRVNGGDVHYFVDLNGDGDAMDVGENLQTGSDPLGHFVGEMEAIPAGSFAPPVSGSFTKFGTAGTSSNGLNPEIDIVGTAAVGQPFSLTVTDALPNLPATLFLGFSDTTWNRPPTIVLPYDMTGIGAPANTLYVAGDFQFTVTCDPSGFATQPLAVPNNPGLAGTDVYVQWYCVDLFANPRGVTMSNAAHIVIGQ